MTNREKLDKMYESMTVKELHDEIMSLYDYMDHVEGTENLIKEVNIIHKVIERKS